MRQLLLGIMVCTTIGIAAVGDQGQQPAPSADPYLNNPAAGTGTFPLAAPAGKDSNARAVAPTGAINQGPFNPATWKYGPAFSPPPSSQVWNPVRLKMQQGAKL